MNALHLLPGCRIERLHQVDPLLLRVPARGMRAEARGTVAQIEQGWKVRKAGALARRFAVLVQASGGRHRRVPSRRLATHALA